MDEEKETQEAVEQPTNVELKIADIITAINIIDFASSKGIFPGKDLEQIGSVRNRLEAFVETVSSKENSQEEQPAESE